MFLCDIYNDEFVLNFSFTVTDCPTADSVYDINTDKQFGRHYKRYINQCTSCLIPVFR